MWSVKQAPSDLADLQHGQQAPGFDRTEFNGIPNVISSLFSQMRLKDNFDHYSEIRSYHTSAVQKLSSLIQSCQVGFQSHKLWKRSNTFQVLLELLCSNELQASSMALFLWKLLWVFKMSQVFHQYRHRFQWFISNIAIITVQSNKLSLLMQFQPAVIVNRSPWRRGIHASDSLLQKQPDIILILLPVIDLQMSFSSSDDLSMLKIARKPAYEALSLLFHLSPWQTTTTTQWKSN